MSFVLVTSGCLIKKATDDLNDAIDDASKKDGPTACHDAMYDVYSDLLDSNDCPNAPPVPEGETADSLATAWCEDNCSDLSEKVELTDVTNCASALYSLECDALVEFVAGTFPTSCTWLSSDLGC
jgi:hypothetical protein